MQDVLFLKTLSAYLEHTPVESEPYDFPLLLRLAQEQKLVLPIYSVLRPQLPAEETKTWRMLALSEIGAQARRTAEFLAAYRDLQALGFSPVVVKGILCRQIWPEPDARPSSDEDLYVRREDYPAFHQALLQIGFTGEAPDYENAHEARYYRNGLMVEGHWELFPQENSALNALNRLNDGFWSHAQTTELEGAALRMLEPTDHMTFLILHAFKHFISSGVGVRQIMDVAQWSKHYEIDWPRVREALRLAHAETFAGAVFDAGARYFGMQPPAGWPLADSGALLADALGGGVYGSSDMSRKHSGTITLAAAAFGISESRGDGNELPVGQAHGAAAARGMGGANRKIYRQPRQRQFRCRDDSNRRRAAGAAAGI